MKKKTKTMKRKNKKNKYSGGFFTNFFSSNKTTPTSNLGNNTSRFSSMYNSVKNFSSNQYNNLAARLQEMNRRNNENSSIREQTVSNQGISPNQGISGISSNFNFDENGNVSWSGSESDLANMRKNGQMRKPKKVWRSVESLENTPSSQGISYSQGISSSQGISPDQGISGISSDSVSNENVDVLTSSPNINTRSEYDRRAALRNQSNSGTSNKSNPNKGITVFQRYKVQSYKGKRKGGYRKNKTHRKTRHNS